MKVYVVTRVTGGYDSWEEWEPVAQEIVIFKTYENALRFMLRKRIIDAKERISEDIKYTEKIIRQGGIQQYFKNGYTDEMRHVRRKSDVDKANIELTKLNEDLKFLNSFSLKDILLYEEQINGLSHVYDIVEKNII